MANGIGTWKVRYNNITLARIVIGRIRDNLTSVTVTTSLETPGGSLSLRPLYVLYMVRDGVLTELRRLSGMMMDVLQFCKMPWI